jgi:hypothetical protein
MDHACSGECICRIDLDKAALALAESSRVRSACVRSGSDMLVEAQFSSVKAASLRLTGAVGDYRDHCAEILRLRVRRSRTPVVALRL